MGGVGKTTLAKLLYNDPECKAKFDLKGWDYIAKDFDVVKVTKTLLESVTTKATDDNNLNTLQVQLQQSLSHKKFLLVLDDIWDENYVDWSDLKDIFNAGDLGSKIIITTRDHKVALAMQTFLPIHTLEPLQRDDCWSLLAKHAFGASNYEQRTNLEVIGREIARKCDGLPLAAVALGGLLRTKSSPHDWNKVLESNIWDLPNIKVKPALQLSYHYLPDPLKRCFAYCSVFPKKSTLERNMIVQLWIAEGLVSQPKSQESWETVGEEYFDELVSRSLIHRRSGDRETIFEMHDLMSDLAMMVSFENCVRWEERKAHGSHERVRHLSYNRDGFDSYHKSDKMHKLKGLRTFLSLPLQELQFRRHISDKVVHELLPTMKQLCVLSLSHYISIAGLLNSIGNLIYLRYLNLSFTGVERLPSETCKLYNLQTLLLSNCYWLTELPNDMGKLVKLRQLDITNTSLKEMPVQIGRLENLQTLSDFVVSKQHDGLRVADLGKFPNLRGKLSISGLQNVTDSSDALQANLKTKKQIEELELNWHSSPDSNIQCVVLEQLVPSTNLKILRVYGYGGTNFPNWLGDSSFGNMVSLDLRRCDHCSLLPPLGQLNSLQELYITSMKSVKNVGVEFYGSSTSSFQPFPSLETLRFTDMQEWEEWKLIGSTTMIFPRLTHLSLFDCPKLKGDIPDKLPSLTKLLLSGCPKLVESRSSSDHVFNQLMLPPLNSLQHLTIDGFPSLTSFPRNGLPKTLQSLSIQSCKNLDFLPHESLHSYTSLEDLHIWNSCNSMASFTLGSLPVLKSLIISCCENLKSIVIEKDVSKQQSLSFLRSIHIEACDNLESFSIGGLPTPNLIHFKVGRCQKLRSLPDTMNTLDALQQMEVGDLPNLQSFAKDGLPINLCGCVTSPIGALWNTMATWEHLNRLSMLEISGSDMVKALMKMEGPLLPASLVSLLISILEDIECLDGKWLQHLTSLQHFYILDAPMLKSLPKEGTLPSSLEVLRFTRCPLLEASLQRKRGKEWRKISHIPSVVIEAKLIT